MSALPSEVPSLIIPLCEKNILVPNSCVAEIVPKEFSVAPGEVYPWLIGEITWRDLLLPCISFEYLGGAENPESFKADNIAIFNTLSDIYPKRFYAIATRGIPRLVRISEEQIVEDNSKTESFVQLNIKLDGESCVIPDLEAIETLLAGIDLV